MTRRDRLPATIPSAASERGGSVAAVDVGTGRRRAEGLGPPAGCDPEGGEVAAPAGLAPVVRGSDAASRLATLSREVLRHVGVILLFSVPAVVLWWHVWSGHPSSTLTCGCGDPAQEVWFIAWPASALWHLANPFFSGAVNVPYGANLLTNTSGTLVGVVLSPITRIWGPVTATNVALTLCPGISAWGCWVAIRRFVDWKPAAIPGALIYGYSTSIITNLMFGHVSVALMVIPPLLFAALHDALVTQKHSPWHDGLVLCALAVVQFAIAPETLVMCGLLAAIAIVAAAAVGWRHVAGRARHAALALVIGAVPTLVLLAYPLWLGLSGPQSINGALYPAAPTSGAALNQFFSAGAYHALPGPLERFAGYMGHAGPPPNFLGWGVGVVALASLVAAWRRPLAWLLVLLAAACAWLSFGTMWLGAPTALTHLWLPWRILQHVRAVNQISPAQLSPFLVLFLACLIGLGLDAAHGAWVRSTPSSRTLTRVAGAGGIALVSLVVLAPVWLTYDVPLVVTPLAIPAWMSQAAPRLGEHTVVLTVPFAIEGDMVPMLWQAEDAMHFRLAGAALYTPEAHGLQVPLRTQGAARQVLTNLSEVGKVEPSSRRDIDAVRAALGKWHTNLVVITGPSQDPVYASGFFAAVLGAPPTMVDGAWVWQVPTQLPAPRPIANGTLARCRAAAAGTSARLRPLTMAHCVLAGPSAT